MKTIFEDEHVEVKARDGAQSTARRQILLSFTGIGHGEAIRDLDVQKPEFFGAGKRFDEVLFIRDKNRTWGNALNFERLAQIAASVANGGEISAIGNSMGGFLSIVMTRYLPIRTCISFVPQFSIDPQVVPWEKRWARYRSELSDFPVRHAGDYFNDTTTYYLFTAAVGRDRRHARRFPRGPNIFHYSFPELGHKLALQLKENGELDAIVQACFAGETQIWTTRDVIRLSPAKRDRAKKSAGPAA